MSTTVVETLYDIDTCEDCGKVSQQEYRHFSDESVVVICLCICHL